MSPRPIGFVWPRACGDGGGEYRHGNAVVDRAIREGRIRYREGGYRYVLVEDYGCRLAGVQASDVIEIYYELHRSGYLIVRAGYAWDGASGPAVDSRSVIRASLIHDCLYQMLREGQLPQSDRAAADLEFRRLCLEDGMSALRAWWLYRGIRIGGGPSAAPRGDEIREAP